MRTLFSNIPSIDLHGFDRDYAKLCIKDFIMDNYKLKKEKVAIIHGIGTGILRKATTEVLKHNKYVKYSCGADASDNVANTEYLCKNGYDGIIHIKSSFCTPEIGIMPIINKVANKYDVPVIFFSFDLETSETGIKTRLEAFYDMLEMRKNK